MQKVFNLFNLTPLKIGLALTLIIMATVRVDPRFFKVLELQLIDQRFMKRGFLPPGPEVVIVAIDEKSQDALGRWPWPRSTLAALVDNLTDANVVTIGFDMVFSESGDNVNEKTLQLLKSFLSLDKGDDRISDSIRKELLNGKTADEQFAESLKNSGNSVLGYFFHDDIIDIGHLSAKEIKASHDLIKPFRYGKAELQPNAELRGIPTAPAVEGNLPMFTESIVSAGFFNMVPDLDGVFRRYPLIIKSGKDFYAPLAVHVLAHYLEETPLAFAADESGITGVSAGSMDIPVDNKGRFIINYYGGPKTFPHFSAVDIIQGNFDPDTFDSRIVLVGATGKGIFDIRATPFAKIYPGVEINATIIDNILQGNFLTRPKGYNTYNYLTVLVLGVFMSLVLVRLSAFFGLAFSFVLLAGYYLGNQELFNRGIWINMVYPSLQIIVVYLSMTSFNYFQETRQKKFIRGAFGQFLSPKVVQKLVENPELLKLGGNQIRMTAFFSDVAGFSGISEKLTPKQLVDLLNEYLTAMTDIILKYDGTIDKYEGDAIIAFWGAPINNPDHAQQACLAAIEMQEKLKAMRLVWKKENRDQLFVRMGINTGLMVVGNMGSTARMDYTVMGDSVNLASRLEGANKVYGTDILISNFTYEDVKESVEVRELDLIQVVGKSEPVSIFELLSRKGLISDEKNKFNGLFAEALEAYRERDWDKARGLFLQGQTLEPDDAPIKTFLERCKNFQFSHKDGRRKSDREALPGPGWDGVFKMTSK